MILAELSEAAGISGQETAVRSLIRDHIKDHMSDLRHDSLGNLIAEKESGAEGPRVMLAAHMDEIGLMVRKIRKDGLLEVEKVGGIDDRMLLAKRVLVGPDRVPGVIGGPPIHLTKRKDRKKPLKSEELTVDVGAGSRDAAGKLISVGDQVTFDTEYGDFGDGLVKGKAFDDRAGCTVLTEVLKEDYGMPVVGAYTVQEEIGVRGARVAAYSIDPDAAIVLEGTTCADIPMAEDHESSTRLGDGPAISFQDARAIGSPAMIQRLTAVADSRDIPWQWRRTTFGGTDAGPIHLTREGVPAVVVSVPCRYIHTPCAVLSLEDLQHTVQLIKAFLRDIEERGLPS